GQMVTRQWVITSAHCFCPSDANSDASVSSTQVQVIVGTERAKATVVQFHPTLDAALLRLERMLPLETEVMLWPGSSSDVVGKHVECQGFDRAAAVDGGAPTSARLRVISSGSSGESAVSLCSAGGTGGQIDGFSVALTDTEDGDAGPVGFESSDAGAPCFVTDADQ